MFDLIINIEKCLSSLVGRSIKSYNKCSRKHNLGDYMIHCQECDISLVLPDLSSKLREMSSAIADCVFVESRQCAYLKLKRSNVFTQGLTDLILNSSLESFKIINFKCVFSTDQTDEENLTSLRITRLCDVLRNATELISSLDDDSPCVSIHVSRSSKSNEYKKILLVGPVKTNSLTSQGYYSLRRNEILGMCEHKLDINPDLDNLDELLLMSVTYDFLHTNIHKEINIDIDPATSYIQTSSKGALFILYNYVRLSVLLSTFESNVKKGIYPKLPDVTELDFGMLKQEEEWCLMFDFILYWPNILFKAFEDLKDGKAKIHHILTFLSHLATAFSHYYHRTRILVEGRPHLLPTIYARIYLLKALFIIYKHALDILGIKPPKIM